MRPTCWLFLAWLLLFLPGICLAAPVEIEVLYFEYPPYYYTNSENQAAGIIVDLARKVFARAGVTAHFTFTPPKRIIHDIRSGRPVASLGWFKTPDREQFAHFSVPLYVNKPSCILYLSENKNKFRKFETLEALMKSNAHTLGRIEGFSDGPYVDALLGKYPDRVEEVAADSVRLVNMLKIGRFDYMLMPPEEKDVLLKEAHMQQADFILQPLRDLPMGNVRYIMFSKSIDETLIQRIDQAILEETAFTPSIP